MKTLQLGILSWLSLIGVLCLIIGWALIYSARPDRRDAASASELTVYCAASMRTPMEEIARAFSVQTGQRVSLQFGGSGSLLANIRLFRSGDLFVAADSSYIKQLQDMEGVRQTAPIATMKPVVAVARENPRHILALADLLRADVRVGLANPDVAAIGRVSRQVLNEAGLWEQLSSRLVVTKPTVSDIANDLVLGAIDATIIWDVVAQQMHDRLDYFVPDELGHVTEQVQLAVLSFSKQPAQAKRFARFVSQSEIGREVLLRHGFHPTPDGGANN